MKRLKTTLAVAGAVAALATAGLALTAAAADRGRETARLPQSVGHCSMHTEAMDAMHDAMAGGAGQELMHSGGMMDGAGRMMPR